MKKTSVTATIVLCASLAHLFAACDCKAEIPDWWVKRHVADPYTIATGNYAPANQGQAKNLAKEAYNEMEACFQGGAGTELDALIASLENSHNFAPVNVGQLKALAQPFYDRLMEKGLVQGYPWSESTDNYAPANVGQLKHLFAFGIPPDLDTDTDGLPDDVELGIGTAPGKSDTDGDGLSDHWEAMQGWNALSRSATDADIEWPNDSQNFVLTDQIRESEVYYWTWGSLPSSGLNASSPNQYTPIDITPWLSTIRQGIMTTISDGGDRFIQTTGGDALFSWNPNDTSDAYSEDSCLSVLFKNRTGWTCLGMVLGNFNIDVRAFGYLEFWMKYDGPAAELGNLKIYTKYKEDGGTVECSVPLSAHLGHFVRNQWFPVRISWADFIQGKALHTIQDLILVSPNYGGHLDKKIKIDTISLSTPLPTSDEAVVYIDRRISGPSIAPRMLAINTATWDPNLTTENSANLLRELKFGMLRFPGGNTSDRWNWATGEEYLPSGRYRHATQLDHFLTLADNLGAEKQFTANYLSGTPEDARACAEYIYHTLGSSIDWWCIGNELYGDWQYSISFPERRIFTQDPTRYADEYVAFAQAIKTVSPDAKVGVCGNFREFEFNDWSANLLSRLAEIESVPDFYEVHFYPQDVWQEHDDLLLNAPAKLALDVFETRRMLTHHLGPAGEDVAVQVGEYNSVNETPGKQSVSLISAIYLADVWAQGVLSGVDSMIGWAFHDKMEIGNNNAVYLDGDPCVLSDACTPFGSFSIEAAHRLAGWEGVPQNTVFPARHAWKMISEFALPGGNMILAHSNHDLLQAYACTKDENLHLMLINKSFEKDLEISLPLNRWSLRDRLKVDTFTYDINQYEVNTLERVSREVAWSDIDQVIPVALPPLTVMVITLHPID